MAVMSAPAIAPTIMSHRAHPIEQARYVSDIIMGELRHTPFPNYSRQVDSSVATLDACQDRMWAWGNCGVSTKLVVEWSRQRTYENTPVGTIGIAHILFTDGSNHYSPILMTGSNADPQWMAIDYTARQFRIEPWAYIDTVENWYANVIHQAGRLHGVTPRSCSLYSPFQPECPF